MLNREPLKSQILSLFPCCFYLFIQQVQSYSTKLLDNCPHIEVENQGKGEEGDTAQIRNSMSFEGKDLGKEKKK